jgi:hypothetical protein
MNISALVTYALKAAGQTPPLMNTQQALQALSGLFDSGAVWRDLTTTGKLPSAIVIGLSALGPRAYKLVNVAPSGHAAGTFLTINAADVAPDAFGRCIAPILSWCGTETLAGRLSIEDLDQAVDVMVQTTQAQQKLWKPTVPIDPLLKAAFTSYLQSSGFVAAFAGSLSVVRAAAGAVGDTLSGGSYITTVNAISTTLSWVSLRAPFDMLSAKYDEFRAQRTSTISTLKKLKSLADTNAQTVTADEKAQIQDLYSQFSAIDAQSQPVLSKVGLWQDMTPLSGLGVWAVAGSVGATVALAIIGALVLLIGMYVALQLNAASKAQMLEQSILSRADTLKKEGKITTAEYTTLIGRAVSAGQEVRESAGGGSFFTGITKAGGIAALLGLVAIGGYALWSSKKKAS